MSAIWWTLFLQMLLALVRWLASEPNLTAKDRQRVAKALGLMRETRGYAVAYGVREEEQL